MELVTTPYACPKCVQPFFKRDLGSVEGQLNVTETWCPCTPDTINRHLTPRATIVQTVNVEVK